MGDEIELFDFEFQRPYMGFEGPNYTELEGEPSAGIQYLVRATLFRQEAVATAKFEMIDERGRVIELLRFSKFNNATDDGDYLGLLKVPAQPFRIRVSGRDVFGKAYARLSERLFRPARRPAAPPLLPPGLQPEHARQLSEALRAEEEQTKARLERELSKYTDGRISVPRIEVSEVTYVPLRSEKGDLLGMRLQYDMRFSADGDYAHSLQVFPSYEDADFRGLVEMEVIEESITPPPSPPSYATPQIHIDMNTLVKYGSSAWFKSGAVYHFTIDLVPDFVGQNKTRTKFCVDDKHYQHKVKSEKIWEAMKARDAAISYRIHLKRTNYSGDTGPFHPPGAFYSGFLGAGAVECLPHKNSNF
jgi:hypothetical protein